MTLAFWSTVALLLAGALLFVLPPLVRPPRARSGASALDVYRDLRAQLGAERASGALSDVEHARAVTELESRVIEEVVDTPVEAQAADARRSLAAILAVALLLPAGALALYGALGRPAALAPSTAQAANGAPHQLTREQMEAMVENLAQKLKKQPDDGDGWHMLARSYVAFDRLPEAAQAFDRARQLKPRDAQLLADYADTLAMLNGRDLEGRPTELIDAALQVEPAHPKALALAGTAAFNRGDFLIAAATWQKLLDTLPPDSDQARSLAASVQQAKAQAQAAAQPVRAASGS